MPRRRDPRTESGIIDSGLQLAWSEVPTHPAPVGGWTSKNFRQGINQGIDPWLARVEALGPRDGEVRIGERLPFTHADIDAGHTIPLGVEMGEPRAERLGIE